MIDPTMMRSQQMADAIFQDLKPEESMKHFDNLVPHSRVSFTNALTNEGYREEGVKVLLYADVEGLRVDDGEAGGVD